MVYLLFGHLALQGNTEWMKYDRFCDHLAQEEAAVVWFHEGKFSQLSFGKTWISQMHCKEHSIGFVLFKKKNV